MSQPFQAIYEHGVFRPLEPLSLGERQLVTLYFEVAGIEPGLSGTTGSEAETIERQQNAWNAFVERMEAMPEDSPRDGFSNRDHDELIYDD